MPGNVCGVVFMAITLIGVMTDQAQSQATKEQLARCAAMTAPALRLVCFDALAKGTSDTARASGSALPASSKRLGNWIMAQQTDPISDKKGAVFTLRAEGSNILDKPTLSIRCLRGELDALVFTDEYLGDDNDEVTIRYGTEQPVQQNWTESSNHTALFYPGDRAEVESFVRKLAEYQRVVIQVSPYNRGPMAMVFLLSGIGQVNRELWALCPPGQ